MVTLADHASQRLYERFGLRDLDDTRVFARLPPALWWVCHAGVCRHCRSDTRLVGDADRAWAHRPNLGVYLHTTGFCDLRWRGREADSAAQVRCERTTSMCRLRV